MKDYHVRDLMTPIEQFPRISQNATMTEAIEALELAQKNYLAGQATQRILLVENNQGAVVAKLSPSGIIRGLEPGYDDVLKLGRESRAHTVDYVITTMKQQALLWSTPIKDLCVNIKDRKITDFITPASLTQTVQADDTLDQSLHHFVMGHFRSLFVKQQEEIVGLLLIAEVFKEICEMVKQCKI